MHFQGALVLTRNGFYHVTTFGATFHRVIDGFMTQGGWPAYCLILRRCSSVSGIGPGRASAFGLSGFRSDYPQAM
jgi:hypothetical protein